MVTLSTNTRAVISADQESISQTTLLLYRFMEDRSIRAHVRSKALWPLWLRNIADKVVIVSITVNSLFVSHVGMKTSTRVPPASGLGTTEELKRSLSGTMWEGGE